MISVISLFLKILCCAGLLLLAYAILFVLNALRIAVTAYLRKPILKQYKVLSSKDDFIPFSQLPMEAETILIAAEDYAFLSHHGAHIPAFLHAMRLNRILKNKKKDSKRGGSGITQQLVKNLYLYPKKTYTRKLAELFLSFWIERKISKHQIEELYFNIVYFGKSQYGLSAAARYYMNIDASALSMNQLISLICLLPNPDLFNPFDNPEQFQKAREVTLQQLVFCECISPEYAQIIAAMPWNAVSAVHDLIIVRHYLTKNACFRKNVKSKAPKYRDFHKTGPRGLMLHSVGCPQSSPAGFLQYWNRRQFQDACVHAFIDANNGIVYQTLPWRYRAWHCGGAANNTHLGIEMCEPDCIRYVDGAVFEVDDPDRAKRQVRRVYASAVTLFALLCQTYCLDTSTIISHHEGYEKGIASDHKDPEHLWEGLGMDLTMDRFRADVKTKLRKKPLYWFSGPPMRLHYPLWKRIRDFLLQK